MEKRDEIGRMFEECKLNVLDLSEKKLRGEGELSFGVLEGSNLGWGGGELRESEYQF